MTGRFTCIAIIALGLTRAGAQSVPTAAEHHQRGLKLMSESPKDYDAAAREFATAYELDPDPKYLFNLALAQRLGGDCRAALESYRAYLQTNPPAVNARNANIGIERCEALLKAQEPPKQDPPPVTPAEKPTPPVETKVVEAPRDRFGTALFVGSGVLAIASGTLYVLARGAASDTRAPGPLADYEDARERAERFQGLSVITGVAAIGLGTWGLIRYVRRSPATMVTVSPSGGGAAVVIGGQF